MSIGNHSLELGRYALYDQIAAGGMASVHFGRLHGAIGFSRVVAIKRLHTHYSHDAHFVQMFLDEARLAARIKHPNVVTTLDVVADEHEVFLVMEYVLGESLEAMMPREGSRAIPLPIVSAIMCGVLEGLHGAHEATDDTGAALDIVHRDVSPHNIIVGDDGVARVFDFGIAKAATNTQETQSGVVKGKVTYMAPEQVLGSVDRRTDLYAAGVILWELLAGRRRHAGRRNDSLFLELARNELPPPQPLSTVRSDVPVAIDVIIARATDPDPAQRFSSAREMAIALEAAVRPAVQRDVSAWVRDVAGERIERLSQILRRIETDEQAPMSSQSRMSIGVMHTSTSSLRPSVTHSTASLTRTATGITSTGPHTGPHTVAPASRPGWTMPIALLAFTAVLLLTGLTALKRQASAGRDLPVHTEPALPAAQLFETAAPPATVPPAPLPPARAPAAAAVASPPAAVHAPVHVPAAQRPPAHATPPRAGRSAPTAASTPASAAPAAPQAPTAPAAAAAPAVKAGCESPFAIGADGIRQIKPECL